MALNAETVGALARELNRELQDGRIEKIQQPEKDLLLVTVRAGGENRKVLIRAAGPNARVHLTEQSFENPREAPMFCMLLRKHLGGGKIREITQPGGDRLMVFSVESRNELGDSRILTLVTELMGRAANVILVDADGRILDCLKRVPPSEHGTRALLPGLKYELPPQPEGFRQTAVQIAPEGTEETGVSAVLDKRFSAMERQELQRRRAQDLVRAVRRARDRQQKKLALQTQELKKSENMEALRREAELLQANLYRVRRGDRSLSCEDYYEADCPTVCIALDPLKTPQQNLSARFRDYRKAKGAREHLTELTAEGAKQLDYLNSVLEELERAETERDLEEIRSELEGTGLLQAHRNARKGSQKAEREARRKKTAKKPGRLSDPLRFQTPDGMEVLVGRNNLQNDLLTTSLARRTDYWLHVKDLHGSHVILCCEGQEPSQEAVLYAASLAAQYSQAAHSGKTAVDCTMVRNVKKPSGALPGKVIYTDYRTVIVNSE